MALQGNLELEDQIVSDAYFKIIKIISTSEDFEYFENVNDPERPDIAQILKWQKVYKNNATFYVYGSDMARKNNAHPIHWFTIEFEYDLDSEKNIYAQAYEWLAKRNDDLIKV